MLPTIVGLVAICLAVVAWRTHKLKRGAFIAENGPFNKAAHAWHRAIVKYEREQAERSAFRADPIRIIDTGSVEATAAQRLEQSFHALQDGRISLSDYRDDILDERQIWSEDQAALRDGRHAMDAGTYQSERDRLDEDEQEIRWRLDWVEKKLRDEELLASRPEISGQGRWARFEYVDHYGEVTHRTVVNWEVSGRYVRGFDRDRKAERNFRIDRISDWKAG